MNYPTKDSLVVSQLQEYDFNSNISNNSLNDPTRNLGSVKDEKFDVATKDNVKVKKNQNVKDKLSTFLANFKKFLGFVGPGYGKLKSYFLKEKLFKDLIILIILIIFSYCGRLS